MNDDKIQDYTFTNGVSYFSPSFFVLSQRNRLTKAKDLRLPDIMPGEKEAVLFFLAS